MPVSPGYYSRYYGTATPTTQATQQAVASDLPIAAQFTDVTAQMAAAGISQQEIDNFLRAEQDKADQFDREFQQAEADATAQNQARIDADNAAFAKAQAEIAAQVAAEQQLIAQQRADYEAAIAAQQAAAAAAQREAEAAQAAIAAQIAETQRLSAEMAQRAKDEMDAMQRTSAAKIAASRKAGRTASDRSLLSGYGVGTSTPSVLGVQGSMGGGGSLGATGTLGVG